MEPATFRLAILRPIPDDRLQALQAALEAQGSPPIAMVREGASVAFSGPTASFMLRSRVFQALADLWGHGEWQRAFQAVD